MEPKISGVFFGLGDMGWVLLHQGWFDLKIHRYMYLCIYMLDKNDLEVCIYISMSISIYIYIHLLIIYIILIHMR